MQFKTVLPTSVCICFRLKSIPSCKDPGLQTVSLRRVELFQDVSTGRIGKTSCNATGKNDEYATTRMFFPNVAQLCLHHLQH